MHTHYARVAVADRHRQSRGWVRRRPRVRPRRDAARAGDWDAAVEHYRQAVQEDPRPRRLPDRARARDAQRLAGCTSTQARVLEARGQYGGRAARVSPRQRVRSAQPADRRQGRRDGAAIRDQLEASRPRNSVQQMREQAARQARRRCSTCIAAMPIDVVFNQREPARHPQLDRRWRPGSTSPSSATSRTASTRWTSRRDVRAEALESDPRREPAVLQGDQRAGRSW